jgi:thiamine biosynthesis lipoprotein
MPAAVQAEAYRYAFTAMASRHELHIWTADRAQADRAARAAIADVLRIEAKYTRYRDTSVTSAINRNAGGGAVAIDAETAALLRYADRCHGLSEGRFDLTSGVLRHAWDFKRQPPRLPSDAEVAALLERVGWPRVEWGEHSIRLPRIGMELDFGGIGKEYAADRAALILRDYGIARALVNLAGDVRVIGARPDGTPWRVGIQHPRDPAAVVATVEIVDGAVATSGDYERSFEIDGQRYCHLLDARTGRPVAHWQSISVVADLATLAGSYATLAMLFAADAPRFLARQGAHYLAMAADGTMAANMPFLRETR